MSKKDEDKLNKKGSSNTNMKKDRKNHEFHSEGTQPGPHKHQEIDPEDEKDREDGSGEMEGGRI